MLSIRTRPLNQEKWLITGLTATCFIILALISSLTWSLEWSLLSIATTLFIASYPLIWVAWKVYSFWRDTLMQLTTYTQILQNDKQNLRMTEQNPDNLTTHLRKEIERLAASKHKQASNQLTTDHLLSQILETWPIPVCLFDNELILTYRNSAMSQAIDRPMLIGLHASELGFKEEKGTLIHKQFKNEWQSQAISYVYQNQDKKEKHWLFSAINVSKTLNQHQSTTQQRVIRVLAHEIRNSLTPMQSMADTLLSSETLDMGQAKLVLNRVNERSKKLLSFIGKYSELSHLPVPKFEWFNFAELLEDAKVTLGDTANKIDYQGNELCFGDIEQISQVMINILKNAKEASDKPELIIKVRIYSKNTNQIIEVADNGPGFGNLDNVLIPFYTTKNDGSGIGLSLCAEIIRNHGGNIQVSNSASGGAIVKMSWPLSQ